MVNHISIRIYHDINKKSDRYIISIQIFCENVYIDSVIWAFDAWIIKYKKLRGNFRILFFLFGNKL